MKMKRYNFDRYVFGEKMAMGIGVHANNMEEATQKAAALNDHAGELLVFRDNAPCATQCSICCGDVNVNFGGPSIGANLTIRF
jgi:hypothetical protein